MTSVPVAEAESTAPPPEAAEVPGPDGGLQAQVSIPAGRQRLRWRVGAAGHMVPRDRWRAKGSHPFLSETRESLPPNT